MRIRTVGMANGIRNDDVVFADFVNGADDRLKFSHDGVGQVVHYCVS